MNKTIYPIIADIRALPLTLTGIGSAETVKSVGCSKGIPSYRFIITTKGSGAVTAGGKTSLQRPNGIVIIPPSLAYTLDPDKDGWSADWLTVSGSMADELTEKLGLNGVFTASELETQELSGLHAQLLSAAERPLPDPRIISALLYAFVLAVSEAVSRKGAEKYNCSITESVRYMDVNYGTDMSLERLAAISGVSLQHFCRVFRSKLGMRPMEYLARTRVAHAKILLAETDGKINDIAKAVGFDDQNYFGITFKKYEGISPSEYRKERGIRDKTEA